MLARPPLRIRASADDDRVGVLYLAPWIDLGGSDKGTIDWFRTIDRTRFRPYLITTQPAGNRWLSQVEPYAEEVWDLPELMAGSQFPGFILQFIASRGIQVIHIMNSRLAFDLLVDISLLPDPPVVVVQFHAEEPERNGYVRYVATRYGNLVDAFSVTSRWLADALGDYDVPASRIEVITTGVDGDGEFDPATVTPFAEVDRSRTSILWPGRLTEQKDPHLTLDVIAELRDRDLDFLVHFVGDGHLKRELERRVAELGIERHIRWYPASQEMARWYASADVLLMTSVFEGIPYVIYEAFAMGIPVVVPALPGNREIVDDEAGWLIDPRDDVKAYADALEDVITRPDRARERGAHARALVREHHTLEQMIRAHEDLYTRLLGRRRRTAKVANPPPLHDSPGLPAEREIRLHRDPPPERTVAVIVPCFQHGRFLPESLASIRAQTLQPTQVIVVDDASEDAETRAMLDSLESEDWLQIIRLERNSGPSAARNRALDAVTANYVLPLDADDKLFEDALERMVEHLERCPEDVGFIYPNPQHFGNRNDYVQVPAYNLFLLLQENYCPATSLFDRRIFDAGIRYDEHIRLGHEDWDLVLQLAGRRVTGRPATGKTFQYRKRGFSRVDLVTNHEIEQNAEVRLRHRQLYDDADRIKATWAPALSVVCLPAPDGALGDVDALVDGLRGQTCNDFEVVLPAGRDIPPAANDHVVVRSAPEAGGRLADAGAAIAHARGRWVVALDPGAEAAFADRTLAEKLIRAMQDERFLSGVAMAGCDDPEIPMFRRLRQGEAGSLRPMAVSWARDPDHQRTRPVVLGDRATVAEDIVAGLDAVSPLQWRALKVPA